MKFTHEFEINVDNIPDDLFQEVLGYVDSLFLCWDGEIHVSHADWEGAKFNLLKELDSELSTFETCRSIRQAEEYLEFCEHFEALFLKCTDRVKKTKNQIIERKKTLPP